MDTPDTFYYYYFRFGLRISKCTQKVNFVCSLVKSGWVRRKMASYSGKIHISRPVSSVKRASAVPMETSANSSSCQGDDQKVRVKECRPPPPPIPPLLQPTHTLMQTHPAAAAHLPWSEYRFVLNAAFYDACFHSWGSAHTHTFYYLRHPTPLNNIPPWHGGLSTANTGAPMLKQTSKT